MAIGLVFTMFGLEQFFQTQSTIFLDRSYITNISVGMVTMFAVINWIGKNFKKFKLDKIQVVCIFLILYSQLSQFWTIAPGAFAQYYSRSPLPYYALYFLIAPILTQDKDGVRNGIWTTVYIGIPLMALIVFFVEWGGRGILLSRPIMEKGRMRIFTPPLALASIASYVAIMCVVLKQKNILGKLFQLVGFALASYVVYRTQSRGQLVALGTVVLIFYPIANQATRSKELVLTIFGFAFLGIALYATFTVLDLGEVNRWTESNIRRGAEGRVFMVTHLLTAWSKSGVFYIFFGLGSAAGWTTSGFAVHNFPAEMLGELGLVGFAIYIYITLTTLRNSVRIIRKLQHYPDMRREAVVLIAMYIFTNLLSIKSISLFSSAPLMFFYAITISQIEKQSRNLPAEPFDWRRLLIVPNTNGNPRFMQPHRPVRR